MNVLGMGPMELMLIVVLALIVFGPAKLPEIMGQIGRAIGDFRRATSELSDEFNRTIQTELAETRAIVDETRDIMNETTSAVREAHMAVGEASAAATTIPSPTRVTIPPTNGPVEPAAPPLAEVSQWSWETAAPPEPKVDDDASQPVAEPTEPVAEVGEAESLPAEPVEDESLPVKREPAPIASDELVPPY